MLTRRYLLSLAGIIGAGLTLPVPVFAARSPEMLRPTEVDFSESYAPREIIILPRSYFLYHVTAPGRAMRYGIAVARQGMAFTGTAEIRRKVEWPTWRPTAEMIARDPAHYGKFKGNNDRMPGGPGNPLGARAMYLYQGDKDTHIRIHGTIEPNSIGTNASSGCFRMHNEDVIALYDQVPIGTKVTVIQMGPPIRFAGT